VTLTYLAGKTENISLGTLITPLPFRPPAMLAKMLSTLDVLSGGRVILGVGAGWSKDEFDGYSTWGEAKYRVDKTIEGLKLMVELWTKDVVDFKGKFYEAKSAVLDPKPVQKPYPRLLFGSQGDRMLRLTGRYANICFIPPWSGEQSGSMKVKVLEAAEKAGRSEEIEFMSGDMKVKVLEAAEKAGRSEEIEFMSGDMGSRGPYEANGVAKKVEAAVEGGASIYMASFPRENLLDSMRRFAEEVMPSYA
jgi:alkanesulfonate monooxygenase SsuD/methylene tetrahydromethanopterin reductase-like flavin-dependent oxidoreductase (luciferase family)